MNKINVYLPCYNEEENIGSLIEEWIACEQGLNDRGYEIAITIIDDKSTDKTREIVESYGEKYKNVLLYCHNKNLNLGGGVKSAFSLFDKNGSSGDVCVIMDGDNTQQPKYVFSMLDKIERGADCVIASRYCKNSEVVGVPKIRLLMSDGAKVFYTVILGVKNVKDYTCGYRIYSYDIIHKALLHYGDNFVEMKTFSCMMEVLYKLYSIGANFDEVPFTLRYDNKKGESKMKVLKTVMDSVKTAIRLRLRIRRVDL